MASLGAPKLVSPFIKFCRWSALITGVVYGASRLSFLRKREVCIKEHEDEIRARIAEKKRIEKERKDLEEMTALGKEAGVVPK